ncbi:TonB-dependent receptor [Pedobacter sp. L105]|uniref:TonB-dependent receptor n=1 Tax=Pedobacter sp. L105 TaxID=1641871 RepID=UPI00131B34F9|nr:TonB-dependent receptor [Pedobacter sp. L105]
MRRILIAITLLFYFVSSFAQTAPGKGKITGKVIDSVSKTAVDFATVSLFKAGATTPFDGMSTDPNGNFALSNLPAGQYRLVVNYFGYRPITVNNITISNTALNIALGNLMMVTVENQLKGVTITGSAPIVENKIDKMVYNTANDLTAQGGVALDVLKKVPMVSVDIDGNVELQGNANVRFLINGKPSSIFGASLADALQSIPASQIKSIEVITSPGAKYDATGTGGIINIVLKDNKVQGINGSVNLSAGTRLENSSVNLNARKGNVGFGVFFSGNEQLNTTTKNTSNRLSYNNSRDTINRLYQQGSSPIKRSSYQSGINFNWSITPKDELTATAGFNHFGNRGAAVTTQDQQSLLSTGNTLSDIMSIRNSASRFNSNTTDMSLGYKKTFKKEGQELDFLYSSSYGKNTVNASQQSDYLNGDYPSSGLQSNNPGKDHETDISVDYTQPISKGFTIEAGGKLVLENLNNNVVTDSLLNDGTYGPNDGQTYGFKYKRDVYAAYLSTSFLLFNDFLEGKAGLRYERTSTTADFAGAGIPGYNTFAPSFTVQHKLDDSQSIKFAYSYRIERPDYGDLNPFYNISDPHNISTGNPLLKPEIGHNYELGYSKTFKSGANIYFAGFYRHNTEDIQSLTTYYDVLNVNGTNYTSVALTQRFNIGSQTGVGANIFGSVPLTKKLNLRSNIQIGERTNSTPGLATVSGFSYRVNSNVSYQFAHDLTAEVFGNYNSSQKNIQSTRPSFYFYNFAVRKQFLKKNASIGLTAANPFSQYVSQKGTTFGSNFNQTNLRQIPLRSFGITLSYKFGKLEFKKKPEDENAIPQQPTDK